MFIRFRKEKIDSDAYIYDTCPFPFKRIRSFSKLNYLALLNHYMYTPINFDPVEDVLNSYLQIPPI